MKDNKIVIQLKGVTKQYLVHHEKPTFSEKLLQKSEKRIFTALDNIDLTIYKGEKIGIIGPNGAGKTTLLKVFSGITTPNSGSIYTKGKIVSLIDLEAGFHPDLTGEENIFLNALIIGMNKDEVKKSYQEIIEFAGIGDFINAPMYTYSAGMKLRLGFSVAVHSRPDILILDENISAADESFRKKTAKRMDKFSREGKTIVIVSQWAEYLEANCKKVYEMKSGKIHEYSKKNK